MEKNCVYCGIVGGVGTDGEGIIRVGEEVAFVPFCLVGEEVDFKVLKSGKGVSYGKAEKISNFSLDRVNPPCPLFYKCGGCDVQHMNYAAQLNFKKEVVSAALKKIGGINFPVDPCVPCDREFRYRNKLSLPIGEGASGEIICGFYARRSHRIVGADDCLIQSEWIKNIISAVKKFAKVKHIRGYNEETCSGELRRIVVREVGGKFVIALVATKTLDCGLLISELEKSFEEFTFLLNINRSRGNAAFSDKWHILRGSGFYGAEEFGIEFRAGAQTFMQVNDDVRAKLYSRVLQETDAGAVALDLYSGGGLLTAMLAKKCGKAYGIEIEKEASLCADELKKENKLDGKMTNICGAVEDELDAVLKASAGKKRIIVCDPPRKGMARSVVQAVKRADAEKIILISCNPATLARDLGILSGTLQDTGGALIKTAALQNKDGAHATPAQEPPAAQTQTTQEPPAALIKSAPAPSEYRIDSITPFDMFPQTKWCETLVVLSHKKPDSHIEVKIDMDDTTLDTVAISERAEKRKPKDKPTYKKIQDWVEENYGFKVHTGYIAEVKRNEGLPMYDAPNAVEELKHPRPHPTPQMVEAIKAALKHFEII